MDNYILVDETPVVEPDLIKWARWVEENNRHINSTHVTNKIYVSTVFLGIDHNFLPGGVPILFETMIFGGPLNDYQERYRTWDEASKGHEIAVNKARKSVWQKLRKNKNRKNKPNSFFNRMLEREKSSKKLRELAKKFYESS